jgi:hypothetical protein
VIADVESSFHRFRHSCFAGNPEAVICQQQLPVAGPVPGGP